jgi:hypothetical protein
MKSAILIIFIFSVFTIAVSAQELVPATSEDQDSFDQQLEQAQVQPVKTNAAATKDRQSRFGSLIKEEASKLKAADTSVRKQMGQTVSGQKRKNPAAAGSTSVSGSTSSSSGGDGRTSAPGLNNSGSPGNSGNKKK